MVHSDQGVAVRVVDLAHDDEDRLDEGPGGAHKGTNDGDGQDQLGDTHAGFSKVEVVHTERAKEKGEQEGDNLLLGCGGHGGLHWGCFHGERTVRWIISLPPNRGGCRVLASHERPAVCIVQAAGGHHDEFNEGPNAGDNGTNAEGQDGDEELSDGSAVVPEVEVMGAKNA